MAVVKLEYFLDTQLTSNRAEDALGDKVSSVLLQAFQKAAQNDR